MPRSFSIRVALAFLAVASAALAQPGAPPYDQGLVVTVQSLLGGDGEDAAMAAATDPAGHLVLAGSTCGKEFPWTVDLRPVPGGCDIFIAKIARDGSRLLFSAVIGGSGADEVADLAVDQAGNVYITGTTTSADYPTRNAFQSMHGGGRDGFLTKIDPMAGAITWSTFLGGTDEDAVKAIALDGSAHVWVAGITASGDFPYVGSLVSWPPSVGFGGFVAKVSATGSTLLLSTALAIEIRTVTADAAGRAYVAGIHSGNVVVAIIDVAGTAVDYSTRLGGSGYEHPTAVTLAPGGDIVVAGMTDSPDLATPGAYDTVKNEWQVGFVARIAPLSSAPRWATYYEPRPPASLAVDAGGNVVLQRGSGWGGYTTGIFRSEDGARSFDLAQAPHVAPRAYAPKYGASFAFDPFDPAVMYAAWKGGGFVSRDYGAHWELLRDYFYRIVTHPFDRDKVFATDGSNVHKSVDGGRTWEFLGRPGPCGVGALAIDHGTPVALYVGGWVDSWRPPDGTSPVLCRSTDEGRTWEARDLGLPRTEYPVQIVVQPDLVRPFRPGQLYALLPSGIYVSSNDGLSWARRSEGLMPDPLYLSVSPSHPSTMYVTAQGGLFRSGDSGGWWELVAIPARGAGGVAAAPGDADVVFVGTPEAYFRSEDGGRTLRLADGVPDRGMQGEGMIGVHPTVSTLVYGLRTRQAAAVTAVDVLSADGRSLLAAQNVNGAGSELAVSATNDIWMVGGVTAPAPPMLNPIQPALRGTSDAFFARIDVGPDADADGMPTSWELAVGLDPAVDDAAADPDNDGATNADEYSARTHPRGTSKAYLAEGATQPFFTTTVTLVNPDPVESAAVSLRFLAAGGVVGSEQVHVAPNASRVVSLNDVPALSVAEFSTVVESDHPVAVGRSMTWNGLRYGSHAQQAIEAPAPTWYFAEGATTFGFQLFYLLQNPNTEAADVTMSWLPADGRPPIERTYQLPALTRLTVWANQLPELAQAEVGLVARSDPATPIIVERAMYLDSPGRAFEAGHESAGATALSTEWFFAEGATGEYFDLFLLAANPGDRDAPIEVRYLVSDGTTIVRTHVVLARHRLTIWVDQEDPRFASSTAVGATIRSVEGVPLVAERAMWWPGPTAATWHGAHASLGVTGTATRWVLADGEVGGSGASATYVLLANPTPLPASVRVTLLLDGGGTAEETVTVAPFARRNISVADEPWEYQASWVRERLAAGTRFGVDVESLGPAPVPIVVEGAIYNDAPLDRGPVQPWAAGRATLAVPFR